MHKANRGHLQPLIISNVNELPEKKGQWLANSWVEDFYHHFFSCIDEEALAVLYVEHLCPPNVSVNWLVALETLTAGQCPSQPGKRDRRFRLDFSHAQAQVAQRHRRSLANKKEGRNLFAAVEASVRQVKHPFPAGKLPVRDLFRMPVC